MDEREEGKEVKGFEKLAAIAAQGRSRAWNRNPPSASQNRAGQESEHHEQCLLAQYLDHLGLLWFAVPSGEKRHIAVAARLQKEGVKRGVSDILILEARGEWHGLCLEVKKTELRPKTLPLWGEGTDVLAWKASGLSDEQYLFLKRAHVNGYLVRVAYGAAHGIKIVEKYLH